MTLGSSEPRTISNNRMQRIEPSHMNVAEICRNHMGIGADRPFDNMVNHILLYKCTFSQNRKDGIKTKDYRVEVIGCVIQLNVHSAM
jgi:hypothetical protein